MKKRSAATWWAVVLVASFLQVGCGSKGPPGAVWVTGSVRYDGQPLNEGAVHFLATAPKSGSSSSSARLSASRFGLYLIPGDYSMAVVSEEGVAEMDMKTGRMIPAKSRIPLKYTTVTDSGLSATVSTKARTVTIDLKP